MGVTNCLVFLTFPYPVRVSVPILKNCAIFIGCNFESHSSKVEEPKEQGRVIFKNKRNHTQKNDHERKDQNFENQGNYKMHWNWRTTTTMKPTYKLLVGGLGCPEKTKEIQDPTKRKYKNQKKNTKLSDIIDICGDGGVSCCYTGHELWGNCPMIS